MTNSNTPDHGRDPQPENKSLAQMVKPDAGRQSHQGTQASTSPSVSDLVGLKQHSPAAGSHSITTAQEEKMAQTWAQKILEERQKASDGDSSSQERARILPVEQSLSNGRSR